MIKVSLIFSILYTELILKIIVYIKPLSCVIIGEQIHDKACGATLVQNR